MDDPRASRPEPSLYFLDAEAGSGLLPWSHVTERLAVAKNYWVATVGPGAQPHCMPVWAVWWDPELVFSSSPKSRRARNLLANPRAVVHLESGDQVVVVEGDVREVAVRDELARFVETYNAKYAWDFTMEEILRHAVFAVRPTKAFAWLDSQGEGFSGTATRWIPGGSCTRRAGDPGSRCSPSPTCPTRNACSSSRSF